MTNTSVCMPAVFPVACHTDQVGQGTTFVAIRGLKSDGITYIATALEKGATKIVVQTGTHVSAQVIASIDRAGATLLYVENTRKALAELSAQAAGYPAARLTLLGITGTKGKTTSSFLLAHMLEYAGHRVALLSTIGNRIAGNVLPTTLTTQQPDYLHQFFKVCVEQNITHVVMEVAAQAVSLYRVHGLVFATLLMTNFSQEHGEFYATMDDYFAAKKALFEQRAPEAPAFINADDVWCASLLKQYPCTIGMSMHDDTAKVYGSFEHTGGSGILGTVYSFGAAYSVSCPALVGEFNAYNSMGIIAVAHQWGIQPEVCQGALRTFVGVPGRLARYALPNGAHCYIDYAHNPSSYQAVLCALRPLTNHLIVVFGAGGERDAGKRPVMGSLAADYADLVIVTSDNPRTEKSEYIIEDICGGVSKDRQQKIIRELDRELAIRRAYQASTQGTIIVLLGKGTEEYQIVGTVKLPFSEVAIIRSL